MNPMQSSVSVIFIPTQMFVWAGNRPASRGILSERMPAWCHTRAGCFAEETAMSTTIRSNQNGVAPTAESNLATDRPETDGERR
jgi:hypothetical protein